MSRGKSEHLTAASWYYSTKQLVNI